MKESIDHFMAISLALVGERHQPVLLARILAEMTSQTHAMGGLILLSQQGGLHPVQSRWQETTTTIDERHTWVSAAGMGLLQRMQQQQLIRRTIDPPTLAAAFPAFPPTIRPLTLLLLPLRNAAQESLGLLILFIDHQHFPVSSRMLAFAQALAGTAAVALNTQRLLDEQKRLLEDFIRIMPAPSMRRVRIPESIASGFPCWPSCWHRRPATKNRAPLLTSLSLTMSGRRCASPLGYTTAAR